MTNGITAEMKSIDWFTELQAERQQNVLRVRQNA